MVFQSYKYFSIWRYWLQLQRTLGDINCYQNTFSYQVQGWNHMNSMNRRQLEITKETGTTNSSLHFGPIESQKNKASERALLNWSMGWTSLCLPIWRFQCIKYCNPSPPTRKQFRQGLISVLSWMNTGEQLFKNSHRARKEPRRSLIKELRPRGSRKEISCFVGINNTRNQKIIKSLIDYALGLSGLK